MRAPAKSSDGTVEYFSKQLFHDSMYEQHVVVSEEQILEDFVKL